MHVGNVNNENKEEEKKIDVNKEKNMKNNIVGITMHERWMAKASVKNNISDGLQKYKKSGAAETASEGESLVYFQKRQFLNCCHSVTFSKSIMNQDKVCLFCLCFFYNTTILECCFVFFFLSLFFFYLRFFIFLFFLIAIGKNNRKF